jgi:two-component system OmpR family response regulator
MQPTILVVDDNKELVTLLTSLFEEAGYRVLGAYKGRPAIELATAERPGLALIDMLLPDMMGGHVAESLRAALPGLPLVFMSGVFKGARHSTEAMTKFPGAAYFEKPFDAKLLLEHVRRHLAPAAVPAVPPSPPPTAGEDFDVELDVDVEDGEGEDAMELTGRVRVTGGGNITADLRGAPLTAGRPVRGAAPSRQGLPSFTPSGVVQMPQSRARRGTLSDNLPGLITAFYQSRETGELYCQRGKVKKVVYFEAGQPVFALSNLASDRFGQFLVRVAKIRPDQLQDAAALAASTQRRTGDVLVELGLLKETERLYFVGQQVKAIIYSLFGWEDGSYVLTFREKALAEAIKLDVFPGNLIVRGIKKLYKPERLARLVPMEDRLLPSQQPAYQLHEVELERWEASLLPRLDGTRTTAEIIALAGKPEHQVRAFLAAMLALQVLERREV